MGCLFGGKRSWCHAGLGVGFQQDQTINAATFIPAEISAANAPTAQHIMGAQRIIQASLGDFGGQIGREDMG